VLRVRDLGSANGTIVNGKKIKEAVIQPGDQLRIGPIGFVVQVDGKPEKITPPAAKKAAVKKEEKAGAKTEDVEIGGPAKDAEAKEDLDILIDDSESIKDDSNLLLDDLN
jgi:pSer/pThr/pTyr-binding forkhead associated (FHA) protein